MKAVRWTKTGQGSIVDMPYPECGPDDVIIKVVACAFCKGSDLEHFDDAEETAVRIPPLFYPITPGHEFSGIVHEIGKNVTNVKIGDRVTGENNDPCMMCEACHDGRFNSCSNVTSIGSNVDGAFAEYVRVKKHKVLPIPDSLSFNAASLTEMTSCGVFALDQSEIQPGDTVIVTGLGAAGAIIAQLLMHYNCRDVVAIGSNQSKLDILNSMGIKTIKSDRNDYSIHMKKAMELHPEGYDVLIDTAANFNMSTANLGLLKRGGKFCEFGVPKDGEFKLDRDYFVDRDLQYRPVGNGCNAFQRAIKCLERGYVDGEKTISAIYTLDEYFEAGKRLQEDPNMLKVICRPWADITEP